MILVLERLRQKDQCKRDASFIYRMNSEAASVMVHGTT